jgi:hypothetical protein
MDKSRKCTLIIDPHAQAKKFISNLGKDHEKGIVVLNLNDSNWMKILEEAIQLG